MDTSILSLQASSLDAEITSLPDPFVNGSKRWEEGRSQYAYFIYHYAGVDASNGDALYYMFEEDDNGNSIPVLDADGNHETSNDWEMQVKHTLVICLHRMLSVLFETVLTTKF